MARRTPAKTSKTERAKAPARALTADLKEVALLAGDPAALDAMLARALDALSDAIPYDMAAVLELEGEALRVRCARGPLADETVRGHRVALDAHPGIRRALESRRARVVREDEHAHGEDPYHGVLDLPDGHSCMVVPLYAADRTLGAMTFDRTRCEPYTTETMNLATIYGQIIALAMAAAEQAARAEGRSRRLVEERRLLVDELDTQRGARLLVASSTEPAMRRIVALAKQVAPTEAPVLITGETGTGKEVLARAIHAWSARADEAFVTLNCASLPEPLVESELFGHVRGAFTGATAARPGRFQVADGGTLLLDEIGDLPYAAQAKLLRVLQEGAFEPVGSDRTVKVDVRILAATHVDLEDAVARGRFREDLYYRLNLFPLHVPPLRERRADILEIADRFLAVHARRTGRGPWKLTTTARERLACHNWPGNVRELVNVLERATILTPAGDLSVDLPDRGERFRTKKKEAEPAEPALIPLAEHEAAYIREVLARTGGRLYGAGGAAEILGLKPSTLQSRMAKLGIRRGEP